MAVSAVRWLLVIDAQTDLGSVRADVEALGGSVVSNQRSVPLGEKDLTVEVEAPQAFTTAVRKHSWVKGVYPSSEMQAY